MIRSKYKELFSMEFTHTYYKSGKCPDILVVPSASTNIILRSLGLRFLQTASGASVYAKVDDTDKIIEILPENTRLTFLMQLQNSTFHNITDIGLVKSSGKTFYFNNLAPQTSSGGPIIVADTSKKIVADADQLDLATNSLSFTDAGVAASKTAVIDFTDTGEQLTQTLDNSDNTFNFSFNLNKTSKGRGTLTVDGAEKFKFFALNTAELSNLFGVVEIFFSATLPNASRFILEDGSIASKHYQIPFANRATKWRYIIKRQFNTDINTITVGKTNGTSINFTVSDGPPGTFVATSDQPIPLSEVPISGIKLGANAGDPIIANLPNPPPNLVSTEGSEMYSDILITI